VPFTIKSGSLNLLEPSGSVTVCNGIALPFTFQYTSSIFKHFRLVQLIFLKTEISTIRRNVSLNARTYYYFFLTAIRLTPGDSSTVHIYTQTIHPVAAVQYTLTHKQYTEYRERNIHNNQKIRTYIIINNFKTNLGSAGRAPSL
jgi:hypothetical protein